MRSNIEQTTVRQPSGDAFKFTISVGLTDSLSGNNLEELIKHADAALYDAKENGRNQVRFYGEILDKPSTVE